jgi:hypothetical protein
MAPREYDGRRKARWEVAASQLARPVSSRIWLCLHEYRKDRPVAPERPGFDGSLPGQNSKILAAIKRQNRPKPFGRPPSSSQLAQRRTSVSVSIVDLRNSVRMIDLVRWVACGPLIQLRKIGV